LRCLYIEDDNRFIFFTEIKNVGKPETSIEEPFIVDCVGPLPKTTSGNQSIFFVNSNKLQINTCKYII
jgi:hypothetical protein